MKTKYLQFFGMFAAFAIGSTACAVTKAPLPNCSFESGYGLSKDQFPAAYNATARFDVQCNWDVFLSGSFIYWEVQQEGMDLAYPSVLQDGKVQIQKFEYKPGFKVALGMDFDHDNWVATLEYTWLHQQTHTFKGALPAGVWSMTNWFSDDIATSFFSSWRAHIDLLDAALSRPYYQGRNLVITPFGGLRAAWIRQNLHIRLDSIDGEWVSHNLSHAWSIGPRGGLQAHYLLGAGFRFEGSGSGSILFTQFTKAVHYEVDGAGDLVYQLEYHDYNVLRSMAEMSVGLGWGRYFDNQKYHFDLLATYDFNIMWGQNMMRTVVDTFNQHATSEPGDLNLQGLTVSARFDF